VRFGNDTFKQRLAVFPNRARIAEIAQEIVNEVVMRAAAELAGLRI
jgi:hypothetical protein